MLFHPKFILGVTVFAMSGFVSSAVQANDANVASSGPIVFKPDEIHDLGPREKGLVNSTTAEKSAPVKSSD